VILKQDFYKQETTQVAKKLLGKYLITSIISGMIVETEAYLGPQDLAAHARFGKTLRNAVLYGPAGRAYVYFIYGKYYCLNAVSPGEIGAGVLIRSTANITGPGRLCQAFGIDLSFNGQDLTRKGPLYIEDRQFEVKENQILITPRIGINYAGEWKDKPLRYALIQS
jgi:DNA-3-methyladenine glycosylase